MKNHKFILTVLLGCLFSFAIITESNAQPYAYVANESAGNVSVINTTTNTITTTVPVGSYPIGIEISPDGSLAYVANYLSSNVSVINTATNTVNTTIAVGNYPLGIAFKPDGSFAYVANGNSNTVSVINTTTNMVTTNVPVGIRPRHIAITPDGNFAYVTNEVSSNVSVINTATNTVSTNIPTNQPFGIAITPDGNFVYVALQDFFNYRVAVISTATNTVVTSVPLTESPINIAITPDGNYAYVTVDHQSVTIINTATNTVTAAVALPSPYEVAITPDGSHAYVSNFLNNNVMAINILTNTVDAIVAIGTPGGIAITPSGQTPTQAIEALIEQVEGLGLPFGIENSLVSKLENTIDSLANNNTAGAIAKLNDFINQVEALSGKKIDESEANDLIAAAEAIIATLESTLPKQNNGTELTSGDLKPENYILDQNFPNPFNPTTQISYAIPEAGNVTLKIYNSVGQLVKTLVDGNMSEGYHQVTWDAKDNNGIRLSSGIYFYTLNAGSFVETKKMILMK